MNFGRGSGSGRLPKLTLLNLLEDWKAQQSTRAARRSLTAERRNMAAEAAAKTGKGVPLEYTCTHLCTPGMQEHVA